MTTDRDAAAAFGLRAIRQALLAGREVAVPSPAGWLVFFVLLSLLLLVGGGVFLLDVLTTLAGFERVLYASIAAVAIGFGAWMLADYGRRLAGDRIALLLDQRGVRVRTDGRRSVFVPWTEVKRVFLAEHPRPRKRDDRIVHRFVSIDVTDRDAIRQRIGERHYASLSTGARQTGALVNIAETLLPRDARHWVRVLGTIAEERRDR